MNKKQIIIDIDSDGNCSIEGENFVGTECGKFIGEIERQLGKVTSSTNKVEYDQRVRTRNKERA